MNSLTVKRVLMTFAGIFLAGVSVAIFKASDFGTDPNSCFVMGVWNLAGIKYSYVYIAINALMLLGVFFLDRHFIGLGTVLNLFFMGIIVEKGMQLFDRYLPERTFGIRVILMCIAVVMMCFASALYFTADMGVSAYDAYALLLDKRTRIPLQDRDGCDHNCGRIFYGGGCWGRNSCYRIFYGPTDRVFQPDSGKAVSLWKREETDTEAVKQKAVVVR